MKKQVKRWSALFLTSAMVMGCLAGCGGSSDSAGTDSGSEEKTVSISANAPEGTVTAYVCNELSSALNEANVGYSSEVYLNGTLGNDTDVADMVLSDNVQFLCTNTANIVTMIPELAVLDMPGAFSDLEEARGTFDNADFRKKLDEAFEAKGFKLLMLGDQGFRNTSSNTKLETVADFKGLDIRTMQNDIHMAYWSALGANPTPMNRSEVFIALQQGMLDAQEDPYVSIEANGYAEVQKYVVDTQHIFSNCVVLTSLNFYNSLSDEQKATLYSSCDELLKNSREFCDQGNEDSLTKLQDEGVDYIHLSDDVRNEIQDICEEKVWQKVRDTAGDDIVDAMISARDSLK